MPEAVSNGKTASTMNFKAAASFASSSDASNSASSIPAICCAGILSKMPRNGKRNR